MAKLTDPYSAKAINPGQLGAAAGSPGWPKCSVPFVIEHAVAASATTATIIPVGGGDSDIRVIAAWVTLTTAGAVDEDFDVRTADGAAAGSLVISLQVNSLSAANGLHFISTGGAVGNAAALLPARTAIDLDGADGLFLDRVSGADAVGTLYLLCVRV